MFQFSVDDMATTNSIFLHVPIYCSNTAADLLTEHLVKDIPSRELLRLHAVSRAKEEIAPSVAAASNLTKEGEYFYPALPLLMQYKVVVTAKKEVANFGERLPSDGIFNRGPKFRLAWGNY